MAEREAAFQVSAEELGYLRELASRDESLAALLKFQQSGRDSSATIRLSDSEAERLRAYLTNKLAAAGFDMDYSPNKQGQILESLIDRFYGSK
jgi:hypothetical protein